YQRETATEPRDKLLAARNGIRIAIDAQHFAIGGFEDGARVAATAERAVDIVPAVLRGQHRQHFTQHHWNMAVHGPPPLSLAISRSRNAFMRAMRSASMGEKRSASQIWNFCDMPMKTILSFSPACSIIASGRRTRPCSSVGSNCVREMI